MVKIYKNRILYILFVAIMFTNGFAQETGETLFNGYCMACHTIGKGKLVGPDLIGINNKYDQDWLIKFIKSSQSMVVEGDEKAVEIFNEFLIPMPDQPLNDNQIIEVLSYIKDQSRPNEIEIVNTPTDYVESAENIAVSTKYSTNAYNLGFLEITLFTLIGIKSLILITLIILITSVNKYLKRIG